MDLKTFVAQTLIQIVEGVNDAKTHINALGIGAAVNPETTFGSDGPPHAAARNVEFDVAVTVASNDRDKDGHQVEGSAGGVLAVVALRAKAQTAGETVHEQREESVSRVKFSVQLGQPGNVERKPMPRMPSSARY